jgi:hypothetical protein
MGSQEGTPTKFSRLIIHYTTWADQQWKAMLSLTPQKSRLELYISPALHDLSADSTSMTC